MIDDAPMVPDPDLEDVAAEIEEEGAAPREDDLDHDPGVLADEPDTAVPAAAEDSADAEDTEAGVGDDDPEASVNAGPQEEPERPEGAVTAARDALLIGQVNQDIKNYYASEKRPYLVDLSTGEVERMRDIFAPPPGFVRWQERRRDDARVFLVHGRELAGKLTCAVNVALARTGRAPDRLTFLRFQRSNSGSATLEEFFFSEEAKKGAAAERADAQARETVYLVEDCFQERLVSRASLTSLDLERRLTELGAYLVLTAQLGPGDLDGLRVEQISAEDVDLKVALEKHLTRYQSGAEDVTLEEPVAKRAQELWGEIGGQLHAPAQIDNFCRRLARLSIGDGDDSIRRAATRATRAAQLWARDWFAELSLNQRLYALFVSLFQGLARQDLDLLYAAAVQELRGSGMMVLEDPRQSGRADLLAAIHARPAVAAVTPGRLPSPPLLSAAEEEDGEGEEPPTAPAGEERRQSIVVFADRAVESEARRQVQSYSALLWSLRPLFRRFAEERQGPDDWRFRRALGVAIGQIGAAYPGELVELLQELALGRSAGVIGMAGAALGQSFATDAGFQALGLDLLMRWIRDPQPALTWVAAVAVWRAYHGVVDASGGLQEMSPEARGLLRRLLGTLTEIVSRSSRWRRATRQIAEERTRAAARGRRHHERLAQSWLDERTREILEAANYALRMIARVDLPAAAELVAAWLDRPSQTRLPNVAVAAAIGMFSDAAAGRPEETTVQALLALLPKLLAFEALPLDSLGIVVRTLRGWLRWEIRDRSFNGLLGIASRVSGEAARRLAFALVRFWLDESVDSTETSRRGQSLLARILAMDGSPVVAPGRERGLILLDTAGQVELGSLAEVVRRLHWLSRSLVDTEIRHLGSTSPLVGTGDGAALRLLLGSPRPRLVVPVVEALGHPPAFVLILACGPLLDLEDALRAPWAGRLIVALPGEAAGDLAAGTQASGAEILFIDPVRTEEVLEKLLVEVIEHRFRALAAEPLAELPAWFRERFGTPGEPYAMWRQVDRWLQDLESTGGKSGEDPARLILYAISWLIKVDPERCVERLQTWRSAPASTLPHQMAVAAVRLLFKLLGTGEWRPPAAVGGGLFALADELVEEWSGAEAVLAAARILIADDEWRSLLFSRPDGVLRRWLSRLPGELRAHLSALAEDWTEEVDGERAPTTMRAAADELRRILDQGGERLLPALPAGGSYRVLFIDADDDATPQFRLAAQVGAGVVNEGRDQDRPWIVFHLGRGAPLQLPPGKVKPGSLLPARPRPRLLYPLLAALPPEQVALVLVVASAPPIDEADLAGSAWLPKIHLHLISRRWRGGGLLRRLPIPPEEGSSERILRILSAVRGPEPSREAAGAQPS